MSQNPISIKWYLKNFLKGEIYFKPNSNMPQWHDVSFSGNEALPFCPQKREGGLGGCLVTINRNTEAVYCNRCGFHAAGVAELHVKSFKSDRLEQAYKWLWKLLAEKSLSSSTASKPAADDDIM